MGLSTLNLVIQTEPCLGVGPHLAVGHSHMGGMDGVALEGLGAFKGGVQHQVGGGRGETVDVDMHFHKARDLACQTFQPFLDFLLYLFLWVHIGTLLLNAFS